MEESHAGFLQEEADKLEKRRARARTLQFFYRFTVGLLFKLLVAGIYVGIVIAIIFPPVGLYVLGAALAAFLLSLVPVPIERYEEYLKTNLLPEIFKRLYPEYTYDPEGLNMESIKASGIFNSSLFKKAERIEGEDRVSGEIKGVKVDFNEVEFYSYPINWGKTIGFIFLLILLLPFIIWRLLTSDGDMSSDHGGSSSSSGGLLIRDEVKFYRGLFLHADFHKKFHGSVYMMPKKLVKYGDRFSDEFSTSGRPINLENAQLNELYQVTAPDPQLAYYLLSPKVLESIFEIYQREKALPIVILRDGQMYMTIPWQRDYFAVDLRTKIQGPEYFGKYLSEIESFQKIVEHMALDTRIWTKN
ncbi:MAG: DUF3137 domain-containing protein [Flavobacteriales bacterium]|nr:DUF3137 domain-containing protein [Flavobacteriales bacterium]